MSYFATGECGRCHNLFTFNPDLVPSLNNVPFCRNCVEQANPIRKANGLAEIVILPGAYDIATEETDTDFLAPAGYPEDDFGGEEYIDDSEPMDPYGDEYDYIDDEVDRDED